MNKYDKSKLVQSAYKNYYNTDYVTVDFLSNSDWFYIEVSLSNWKLEKTFLMPIRIEDIDAYVKSEQDGIKEYHIENECYEATGNYLPSDRLRCERARSFLRIGEIYKNYYKAKNVSVCSHQRFNSLIMTIELENNKQKICYLPVKDIFNIPIEHINYFIENEDEDETALF